MRHAAVCSGQQAIVLGRLTAAPGNSNSSSISSPERLCLSMVPSATRFRFIASLNGGHNMTPPLTPYSLPYVTMVTDAVIPICFRLLHQSWGSPMGFGALFPCGHAATNYYLWANVTSIVIRRLHFRVRSRGHRWRRQISEQIMAHWRERKRHGCYGDRVRTHHTHSFSLPFYCVHPGTTSHTEPKQLRLAFINSSSIWIIVGCRN